MGGTALDRSEFKGARAKGDDTEFGVRHGQHGSIIYIPQTPEESLRITHNAIAPESGGRLPTISFSWQKEAIFLKGLETEPLIRRPCVLPVYLTRANAPA